jgi:hypothetical protein
MGPDAEVVGALDEDAVVELDGDGGSEGANGPAQEAMRVSAAMSKPTLARMCPSNFVIANSAARGP